MRRVWILSALLFFLMTGGRTDAQVTCFLELEWPPDPQRYRADSVPVTVWNRGTGLARNVIISQAITLLDPQRGLVPHYRQITVVGPVGPGSGKTVFLPKGLQEERLFISYDLCG